MTGLSPRLPLMPDEFDGFYGLNKSLHQVVQQNLKNLMLTNPGERVMIPQFGAGLSRYLFAPDTPNLQADIAARIRNQVERYMPFIFIETIDFSTPPDQAEISMMSLFIEIKYSVPSLNISNLLSLNLTP